MAEANPDLRFQQEIRPGLEILSFNLWKKILLNMQPQDFVRCSLACKDFYSMTFDEYYWFRNCWYIIRSHLFFLKIPPKDEDISYRKYFQCLFELTLRAPVRRRNYDFQRVKIGNETWKRIDSYEFRQNVWKLIIRYPSISIDFCSDSYVNDYLNNVVCFERCGNLHREIFSRGAFNCYTKRDLRKLTYSPYSREIPVDLCQRVLDQSYLVNIELFRKELKYVHPTIGDIDFATHGCNQSLIYVSAMLVNEFLEPMFFKLVKDCVISIHSVQHILTKIIYGALNTFIVQDNNPNVELMHEGSDDSEENDENRPPARNGVNGHGNHAEEDLEDLDPDNNGFHMPRTLNTLPEEKEGFFEEMAFDLVSLQNVFDHNIVGDTPTELYITKLLYEVIRELRTSNVPEVVNQVDFQLNRIEGFVNQMIDDVLELKEFGEVRNEPIPFDRTFLSFTKKYRWIHMRESSTFIVDQLCQLLFGIPRPDPNVDQRLIRAFQLTALYDERETQSVKLYVTEKYAVMIYEQVHEVMVEHLQNQNEQV